MRQDDETTTAAAMRWINSNARQGWTFVQVLDLDDGSDRRLLFEKAL
jgi:hypothetical protein